jgi:hypothetical protein
MIHICEGGWSTSNLSTRVATDISVLVVIVTVAAQPPFLDDLKALFAKAQALRWEADRLREEVRKVLGRKPAERKADRVKSAGSASR